MRSREAIAPKAMTDWNDAAPCRLLCSRGYPDAFAVMISSNLCVKRTHKAPSLLTFSSDYFTFKAGQNVHKAENTPAIPVVERKCSRLVGFKQIARNAKQATFSIYRLLSTFYNH